MLSKKVSTIEPSATLAVSAIAKELAKKHKIIHFSIGEPNFKLFDEIKKQGKQAINQSFSRYTKVSGIDELRKGIAKKFKKENNITYSPEEIIVSNGAKHALFNVLFVLCNPGDEIIILRPYWVSYLEQVKLVGATPIIAETDNFKITAECLKEKITRKTKAIILNYPCNPTGTTIDKKELIKIANLAVRHNIFIISDEVYEYFTYDRKKHISIASLNRKIWEKTITVNSFSKSFSMPGVRLGYCGGPKEIITMVGKLQSHTTSGPCSIAQKMGVGALEVNREKIRKIVKSYEIKRDYCVQILNSLGLETISPKGAFYLFSSIKSTKYAKLKSVNFCKLLLEKEKVAVVPGIAFGSDDYIRLCYALDDNQIKEGLKRIERFLK